MALSDARPREQVLLAALALSSSAHHTCGAMADQLVKQSCAPLPMDSREHDDCCISDATKLTVLSPQGAGPHHLGLHSMTDACPTEPDL